MKRIKVQTALLLILGLLLCALGLAVCGLLFRGVVTATYAAQVASDDPVVMPLPGPTLLSDEPDDYGLPEPDPPEPPEAEVQMLAIVIYREAGGDACSDLCRRRVGDVVLNRLADPRFPDTLEGVLTQRGQYGTMAWTGITWPERANQPGERNAVARAERIARELLTGQHSDLYGRGYVFQSEFPDLGHDAILCCGVYFAKG